MLSSRIREEVWKVVPDALVPSAFIEYVQGHPSRRVSDCLSDELATWIATIEIPDDYYGLAKRYSRIHPIESAAGQQPPTSFNVKLRTWGDVMEASRMFCDIAGQFDIFPVDIYFEGHTAMVCCDT